jgi:hypothetical protein
MDYRILNVPGLSISDTRNQKLPLFREWRLPNRYGKVVYRAAVHKVGAAERHGAVNLFFGSLFV